jgi:hypothetical protein
MNCPLGAPPEAGWPARAWRQLNVALSDHVSCRDVLAFADAHQIAFPVAPEVLERIHIQCLTLDHECDAARARYHDVLFAGDVTPERRTALAAEERQRFAREFHACVD